MLQGEHSAILSTFIKLMQVKSIAECSKGSILQFFRPSLSYHLSLRYLFCLFFCGHFTQVLHILQYFRPSLSYHLSLRYLFCLFFVAISHRFYCISKNNLQSVWSNPFGSTSSAGFNISKMLILGFKPEYDKTLQLLQPVHCPK